MLLSLVMRKEADSYGALRRFSAVGTATVIAIAISGLVNAVFLVDFDASIVAAPTRYEGLLLLKLVLFGGMFVLAAVNRILLTPRLASAPAASEATGACRALRGSIAAELGLAVAVLALVVWLGTLDPAS